MDCPLDNTFLLTFRTLVWRILWVRAITVVSCCRIFLNPSQHYSKRQTRGEEIEKCLNGDLEPSYYLSIFRETSPKNHSLSMFFIYHNACICKADVVLERGGRLKGLHYYNHFSQKLFMLMGQALAKIHCFS